MNKDEFLSLIDSSLDSKEKFGELCKEIIRDEKANVPLIWEYLEYQDLNSEIASHILDIYLFTGITNILAELVNRLEPIPSYIFDKLVQAEAMAGLMFIIPRENRLTDFEKSDLLEWAIDYSNGDFGYEDIIHIMLKNGFYVGDYTLASAKTNFLALDIINNPYFGYQFIQAFIQAGCNPFAELYLEGESQGVPLIWFYLNKQNYPTYDLVRSLSLYVGSPEEWNQVDEWGRNLLHICPYYPDFMQLLIEKGVNPDHRAVIEDKEKVVKAKMRGVLPEEYGKTPRELIRCAANPVINDGEG